MLQLSANLINQPVLSLRTGSPIAITLAPIIDPNNLKIEAFYCEDKFEKRQLVLLYQDIRDVIKHGFVVNDLDVLVEPSELVRLKETMDLEFELLGKQVVTTSKQKLGKVGDYATETESMFIQKLYVTQPLLKSLSGGSLSVDRTNIVEITNRKVIVNEILKPKRAGSTIPMAAPAPPG